MADNKKIEYSEEGQAPAIVNTDGTLDVPTFPEGEYKGEEVVEKIGEDYGELSPNPNYPAEEVLWFDGNRFLKGSAIWQAWETAKAKPAGSRTPFEKWLVEDGQVEITSQLSKEGTVEGTETIVGTPKTAGIKVERNLVNFINGLLVKGKKLEDYIDSQGGVTQEELTAALAPIQAALGNIDEDSLPRVADPDGLTSEQVEQLKGKAIYSTEWETILYPAYYLDEYVLWFTFLNSNDIKCVQYVKSDDSWELDNVYEYDLSQIGQGGGTKLYRHTLTGSFAQALVVYNHSNELIDTTFKLRIYEKIGFYYRQTYGSNYIYAPIAGWYNTTGDSGKLYLIMYNGNNTSMSTVDLGNVSTAPLTDVVTEL